MLFILAQLLLLSATSGARLLVSLSEFINLCSRGLELFRVRRFTGAPQSDEPNDNNSNNSYSSPCFPIQIHHLEHEVQVRGVLGQEVR
jgi:hypothetical protein